LDRPTWAPVILSGALPRESSDLLAIAILDLASIQLVFSQAPLFSGFNVSWILLLLVPLTGILAAMSNSPDRQREELALVAYGGSTKQIEARYVLRGSIITAIGLLPLLLKFLTDSLSLSPSLIVLVLLILVGGSAYATPALRRTRSLNFVEQYKG
jgi:hypothetical protein